MEQSYTEATAKRKTSAGVIILKVLLVTIVVLLVLASLFQRLLLLVAVAGGAALIWYWPRFKVTWEYIYCDGQLDFDMIQGGERRKNILRIEIENADAIALIESERLAGYRHLEQRDYSSRNGGRVYGIATRLPDKGEEKVLLLFEPSEKMVDMMHAKCPNIVEKEQK